MTSLAFTMGMVPLVLASGAGAASRIAVGTGVMGGMIAATVLGIFLIPMLYLLVRRNVSRKQPVATGGHDDSAAGQTGGHEIGRDADTKGEPAP